MVCEASKTMSENVPEEIKNQPALVSAFQKLLSWMKEAEATVGKGYSKPKEVPVLIAEQYLQSKPPIYALQKDVLQVEGISNMIEQALLLSIRINMWAVLQWKTNSTELQWATKGTWLQSLERYFFGCEEGQRLLGKNDYISTMPEWNDYQESLIERKEAIEVCRQHAITCGKVLTRRANRRITATQFCNR